jgi:hypothetical protein
MPPDCKREHPVSGVGALQPDERIRSAVVLFVRKYQ